MDIPPQLMFLHQGQREMKELRFHPQFRTIILTTAEDSFNIFRPNLDPDYEEDAEMGDEETKEGEKSKIKSGADYSIEDSDEDVEAEERRIMKTTRELNK